MFTAEGTVKIKITDVTFADAKFAQGDDSAFDICIKCEGIGENEGKYDWWRGEMSNNYGKGTVSHMTQAQLTFRTLRKLGFKGDDLTSLYHQVVGTETEGFVKASAPNAEGKVFYNLRYIGASDFTPTAIDDVASRFKKLMAAAPAPVDADGGEPATAPAPKPKAPAATGKARNPFG
jgi:hypothetical protein